ncbi:MAG: hypothetical protein LBN39_02690 [Planctomycetaceae bacterium]|jgi:hypothetical protein|nr:hypothetical protein [Planctomycetaceae bacterium]
MNCTLFLQSRFNDFPVSEVAFEPRHPNIDDIDEKNPVFEDGHYQGFLQIENDSYSVESVELFLNGDTYIGRGMRRDNGYDIRFEDERGNEISQPFQLLYDLVELSVRVSVAERNSPLVLYSRYLSCISKQEEDTQNASEMLKSLLDFEDDKIGRWMFSNRKFESSPDTYVITEMRQQPQTYKSPAAYITLLESIAICYQTNLQYFNALARHSIKKVSVVREYAKARNITREGFQWVMQNTDQLTEVSNKGAVRYRGSSYMPRNILIQEPVSNRDVYENQVVLSFLMLVLKNALSVKDMLGTDISERENTLQKIQETVREGYQPPAISAIWQLPLKESKVFYNRLVRSLNQLEALYVKYNETLDCKKFDIKSFPRKTKTFQEVKPYSQVFEHITKWFRFGDFDMKKNRVIFNLRTLDKLFEYYSLYRLLKMFTDAGFDDVQDKPTAVSYQYRVFDSWFENETDVANTYYLEKDDCQLTLYYQPVIHSDRFENDLTVFRTTIVRRNLTSCYYTPDFLIKLARRNKNPLYIILDSKYSNRMNILRRNEDNSQTNYLDKVVLKYSSQLAVKETQESPKMIWILQGRVGEGDERTLFRFHNSPLARQYPPKTNYGIVSVNTGNDTLYELWKEIQRLEDSPV